MSGDDRQSGRNEDAGAAGAPKPGLPTRIDLRRAFDVYVYGRNRTLGPDQKGAAVSGSLAPRTPASGDGPGANDGGVETPARVPVPEQLRFDRNAGTWRDRLPGSDGGAS